jgi:hypothetical protein
MKIGILQNQEPEPEGLPLGRNLFFLDSEGLGGSRLGFFEHILM